MRREVEGRLISVDFTLVILATDFFAFGAAAFLTLFFGAVALTVGVEVVAVGINSLLLRLLPYNTNKKTPNRGL